MYIDTIFRIIFARIANQLSNFVFFFPSIISIYSTDFVFGRWTLFCCLFLVQLVIVVFGCYDARFVHRTYHTAYTDGLVSFSRGVFPFQVVSFVLVHLFTSSFSLGLCFLFKKIFFFLKMHACIHAMLTYAIFIQTMFEWEMHLGYGTTSMMLSISQYFTTASTKIRKTSRWLIECLDRHTHTQQCIAATWPWPYAIISPLATLLPNFVKFYKSTCYSGGFNFIFKLQWSNGLTSHICAYAHVSH